MAVTVAPVYAAADMLCCLGLGFLLAILYEAARFVLGRSLPAAFCLDLLAAFSAAVLLYSFAAGRSYSGQVRWYMTASLLLGLWSWFSVLDKALGSVRRFLVWIVSRPFVLVYFVLLRPLLRGTGSLLRKTWRKIHRRTAKPNRKQLKKPAQVLYNSNN